MKQDKNWNKMVAVPPVKKGLYPPVDRIKIQLDRQPTAHQKALPVETARSIEHVIRTTRLVVSSPVSRQRGRGRSHLVPYCPPVAIINSSGCGAVPDLNRSVERVDDDLNSSQERASCLSTS
jgi:hypothetical protein